MSRNQKAPLLAFVLVALVCSLVLVDSMRGDAVDRRLDALETTRPHEPGSSFLAREPRVPAPDEPGATDADVPGESLVEPNLPSSGTAGAPSDGTGSDDGSAPGSGGGTDGFGSKSWLDEGSVAGAPGLDPDPTGSVDPVEPGDPVDDGHSPGSGHAVGPPTVHGPPSHGPPGHVAPGPKDPNRAIHNFGPDGGRPQIDPDELEPLDDAAESDDAGTDAGPDEVTDDVTEDVTDLIDPDYQLADDADTTAPAERPRVGEANTQRDK